LSHNLEEEEEKKKKKRKKKKNPYCIVYRTIRSQDDSCKLQNDISSLLNSLAANAVEIDRILKTAHL